MTSYPLPVPCLRCGGVVVYSGRGARPRYCSPKCRAAADVATRSERRAERLTREERAAQYAAADAEVDRYVGSVAVAAEESLRASGSLVDIGTEVATLLDGNGRSTTVPQEYRELYLGPRGSRASRADAETAAWLAEHHPEEVADFPRAMFVGRTARE